MRRPRWSLRYPRERLVSTLPGLLAPSLGMSSDVLGSALGLSDKDADFSGLSGQFLAQWNRYN
jgi:hypothetical protein